MVKVMAINAGSSSLKFQLINMPSEEVITSGLVERIGLDQGNFEMKYNGEKFIKECPIKDHSVAVQLLLDALVDHHVVESLGEIEACGHRVVHGGEYYNDAVKVDEEVVARVEELAELAPLHNPAHIVGYNAFKAALPEVEHVFVFDTAFHQTLDRERYLYPLPYEYYTDLKVRKYGAHGTSHKYVSQVAIDMLGNPKHSRVIVCHLGNGASLCAVKNGVSIDTSMGFTPLEGVAMGTRSGNIDPAIVTFLMKEEGLSIDEVNDLLNKKSGVLGISGISSDFRDIEDAAFKEGVHRAKLALAIFEYKVRATIGSYAAIMGGVDAIVFTAGVGENGPETRESILKGLEFLGVEVDTERNNVRGKVREISKDGCKVKAFVIPTNEELVIARDTVELIK